MDIDSPPAAAHTQSPLSLPTFSSAFPLPFRVLTLVGLAILLWATNVHLLTALNVDVARALDLGGNEDPEQNHDNGGEKNGPSTEPAPSVIFDATRLEGDQPKMSFDGYGRPFGVAGRDFSFPNGRSNSVVGLFANGVDHTDTSGDRPTARQVYRSVYALFVTYSAYVGAGWLVFRLITRPTGDVSGDAGEAERERMERWRAVVGGIVGVLVLMGFGTGFGWGRYKVGERERQSLLRSFRRILIPPTTHAPFFADVILADILTSFAKVLGDLWVSACQIWSGGITKGRVRVGGVHDWVVLGMVSLPYLLRLRQCIHEYLSPNNTSSRPLLNAIKYASAFPVIFLSAAQRTVVRQVAEHRGVSVEELKQASGRWFGEHRLFRLWLLAVVVNSMYSFWWDVTNDWGLELLQVSTWFPAPEKGIPTTHHRAIRTPGFLGSLRRTWASVLGRAGRDAEEYELSSASIGAHQRSPMPASRSHLRRRSSFTIVPASPSTPPPSGGSSTAAEARSTTGSHVRSSSHSSHFNPSTSPPPSATTVPTATHSTRLGAWFSALPFRTMPNPLLFGLRPRLLFPDPLVYHLAIAIDFILRFTWSLKLSSHLHTVSEIESGVFIMEALELFRRWMWVFLRTEWEVVKKMEGQRGEGRVVFERGRRDSVEKRGAEGE